MAKGRNLTPTSRRERFLGTNTTTTETSTSEFREEEVWSTEEEGDVSGREREQRQRHVGGLSLAFDDDEMVPPHEYLARSRKMAANSVFEGVGRTLKGRDMRRVRDAVWSQTGFDG